MYCIDCGRQIEKSEDKCHHCGFIQNHSIENEEKSVALTFIGITVVIMVVIWILGISDKLSQVVSILPVILGVLGIFAFILTTFAVAAIEKQAEAGSKPRKLKIKSITSSDLQREDITDYFSIEKYLEQKNSNGDININLISFKRKLKAAVKLAAWKIRFKEAPITTCFTFILFFPIPMGWIILIALVVIYVLWTHQAGQFEKEVNDYLMLMMKKITENPINKSYSLSEEIEKLEKLKNSGALTEVEFNMAKEKLFSKK